MSDLADFRDQVRQKLSSLTYFREEPEELVRVFYYLGKADEVCSRCDVGLFSPLWKNFKYLLDIDEAFEALAKRYAEDTKHADQNPGFVTVLTVLYNYMMTACDDAVPLEGVQGFDLQHVKDNTTVTTFGLNGLIRSLRMVPPKIQAILLRQLPRILNSQRLVVSVDDCISQVSEHGGQFAMYALAAVYLCYHALENIKKWWKGEISGKRCVKNIIVSSSTALAGVGGGILGAGAGTFIFPGVGTLVGGIVGGIVISGATRLVFDRLTQNLFDLPKGEAVENAYRYLEVNPTASNEEVNIAFRKLCLKHYPNNGGSEAEFFILQNNMAVIREARGEGCKILPLEL